MKFYSEKTKKLYDRRADLDKAEVEYDKVMESKKNALEEKKLDAKKVEESYKKCIEANELYIKHRNDFVKKHGSFHMTFKDESPIDTNLFDLFSTFFSI